MIMGDKQTNDFMHQTGLRMREREGGREEEDVWNSEATLR